jgi:hypothetical protein
MSVITYPVALHHSVPISPTNHDVETNPVISRTPSKMWIAFTKNGHHYIASQPRAPTDEQQMHDLQLYYNTLYSPTERFLRRWIFCQIPIVQAGTFREVNTTFRDVHNIPTTMPISIH